MTIRIFAILALLSFMGSASAFRVIEQPERPFELALSQLTLPKDTAGSVTLRACERCAVTTHRFADNASFVVDGRALPYLDFLLVVNELRGNSVADAMPANVFVDVNTERVTRVMIHRPRH